MVTALVTWTLQPAQATTMVAMGLAELAATAGAIVHGTVTGVRSEWSPDRTHIVTYVAIHAGEYLKGSLGQDLTIQVPGGESGGFRQMIPGAPVFAVGEEVLLFLSVRGPAFPAVTGLSQGKFTVVQDPASGVRMMTRTLYGASVIGRGDPLQKPVSLPEFEDQIRDALRRGRAAGAGVRAVPK